MLKYLVIQLADNAVSFCHYPVPAGSSRLIALEDLKGGIVFAMKENLNIQFVYPDSRLPESYRTAIEGVDHTKIMSAAADDAADADVVVLDGVPEGHRADGYENRICLLRIGRAQMEKVVPFVREIKSRLVRLNVVLTDVESFGPDDFSAYEAMLLELSDLVAEEYLAGNSLQINLVTDRLMLSAMNNCNAGAETLTLAPDGRFYVCPAFYYEDREQSCGDPESGVDLKNPQLYELSHAPICRHCDAYQCRRCVWLNRRMTLEVNTPSHEQCVIAHAERSAGRGLLNRLRQTGEFMPKVEIPELDYTDPFEKHNEW